MKLHKFLLGVPTGASNIAVRTEISCIPLRIKISAQILKFYYRMKLGSMNDLLNQTFKNIADIALNPFARFLTLLTDCNFPLPNPSQPTQIKSQVKKLIPMAEKILNENWDIEIPYNRKLGTYDSIKESHDREAYLEFIGDRNLRKYFPFHATYVSSNRSWQI